MIGFAPRWLFAVLAAAAVLGCVACGVSVVLRPLLTGVVCNQGCSDREAGPLVLFPAVLFLATGVAANTFWVLGA